MITEKRGRNAESQIILGTLVYTVAISPQLQEKKVWSSTLENAEDVKGENVSPSCTLASKF